MNERVIAAGVQTVLDAFSKDLAKEIGLDLWDESVSVARLGSTIDITIKGPRGAETIYRMEVHRR